MKRPDRGAKDVRRHVQAIGLATAFLGGKSLDVPWATRVCSGTLCPQPRDRSTGGKPSLGKVIGHIGGRLYDNRFSAERTSRRWENIVVRGKDTGTPAGEFFGVKLDRQEL